MRHPPAPEQTATTFGNMLMERLRIWRKKETHIRELRECQYCRHFLELTRPDLTKAYACEKLHIIINPTTHILYKISDGPCWEE